MYSRYNRDETKNWEQAWYHYQQLYQENSKSSLWIVGQFSAEQIEYNFDFYRNEKIKYFGVISEQEKMAEIYRGADYFLYTYFNDACSNTLIEAISCGVEPLYYSETGGAIDIKEKHAKEGIKYFSLDRMAREYKEEIERIL
jgi:glycosyltransferase involved in cell wall biosynthesis